MKQVKPATPYMVALHDRIVDTAMHAFATKGIKAVKMDDIAKLLGISKRTLYEVFENKEILLYEGVKKYKALKEEEFHQIYIESADVMDILLKIYRMKVEEFKVTCPEFYSDLSKYPSVQEFFSRDKELQHNRFVEFLKRGVDEGYFRKDLNLNLLANLFSFVMQHIMEEQLYKTCSIEEIFHNIVFVSLRGFSTLEGIKRLEQYDIDK